MITTETLAAAYLVIINGNNTYTYISKSLADYVYDINKQESSKGFSTTQIAEITNGTTASFVPEPTSGLMMILGVASLALRRKRD